MFRIDFLDGYLLRNSMVAVKSGEESCHHIAANVGGSFFDTAKGNVEAI